LPPIVTPVVIFVPQVVQVPVIVPAPPTPPPPTSQPTQPPRVATVAPVQRLPATGQGLDTRSEGSSALPVGLALAGFAGLGLMAYLRVKRSR
jgi:hypothetical protein